MKSNLKLVLYLVVVLIVVAVAAPKLLAACNTGGIGCQGASIYQLDPVDCGDGGCCSTDCFCAKTNKTYMIDECVSDSSRCSRMFPICVSPCGPCAICG
jgi:predicted small secreted protein